LEIGLLLALIGLQVATMVKAYRVLQRASETFLRIENRLNDAIGCANRANDSANKPTWFQKVAI
jgi:hypothetical protein